jgi:membrane protease YdiL (CAAX protease family)
MNSRPAVPYVSQFFILLGVVAGAFIIALFVIGAMMVGAAGANEDAMKKAMLDPDNANLIKTIQLAASAVIFLVPAFVFARIVSNRPLKHLGLKTGFSWAQLGLAAVIIFIAFYLSGALGELTYYIPIPADWEKTFKAMEQEYTEQVMIMARMNNISEYLYSLLVIAIAPAIFEELLFRGALQQLMVKWTKTPWLGILITSILFSAVHFSYYGFLARAGLGMILGYLFYYSKSLWVPMVAHFINNGFAVTMMYIMNKEGKLSPKALDERFPVWYGVIALGIIIALLIVYRNECKKRGTYYLDNTETKSANPFEDNFDFEERTNTRNDEVS